jgi:uncharacterized protein (DUF433 family)
MTRQERLEQFDRLVNRGMTRDELASFYGVNPAYISAVIKFLGVQVRKKGSLFQPQSEVYK